MIDRDEDGDRPADKGAPKRKGPIVNRRGPSEVSRAIQMLGRIGTGRPPSSGRKPATGGSARGTVVRLDKAKGYGFIVDASGEQRFFHRTSVLDGGFDALKEQQAVDFEPYSDERGARAQKVRPAGSAPREGNPSRPAKPAPRAPKASAWKSDLSPFRDGSGAPTPGRKRPKI